MRQFGFLTNRLITGILLHARPIRIEHDAEAMRQWEEETKAILSNVKGRPQSFIHEGRRSNSVENPSRHKIGEAEYFLSMMKQVFEDDDIFSYNLSAFLSAARSITWHMQTQYARCNGFTEWYRQIQRKMSADSELKYLNEVRVEDVHREPVRTGATRQSTVSIDAVLDKEGVLETKQVKEVEHSPSTQSSPKTVRRFFPKFGRVDVIEFCERQLTKLTMIVSECEKRF